MNPEDELRQITDLCEKLGSPRDQAETMAQQLVKRADQLVEERGLDRIEAMQRLLELVVSGRQGVTPPEFSGERTGKSDTSDEI